MATRVITNLKKGDTVQVIAGENKGKKGRILKLSYVERPYGVKLAKVIVEGVNFVKKHTRANQKAQQGGIIQKEAPIYVNKVMLLCAKCGKSTKIGMKFLRDGKKTRFCKKCGELVE
jgi:large subunit ribosomal protein L24